MKFTPLMIGLWLSTAANLLVGAPAKDLQISNPSKKDSPTLSDQGRSPAPDGPVIYTSRDAGPEDRVVIVGVTEEKPDANGRRKVTVRVHYALVHYAKGMLSLGFNLKSATRFAQVGSQVVMAGEEEVELTATIVPVTWPKPQPFKLSVGLSVEPRPGQWTLLDAVAQPMKPMAAPAPAK